LYSQRKIATNRGLIGNHFGVAVIEERSIELIAQRVDSLEMAMTDIRRQLDQEIEQLL